MPDVSVVIAVLNSEKSIGRCIESVLASRYAPEGMELICVDNGSTDGTAAVLRKYQPRIRVLEERRRGASAARNAGLRVANGEFVAFTDADCFVHPDWVANILRPLKSGMGAAGGRILARPEAKPIEMFGELIHDHAMAIECGRPPYLITMNMASRISLLRSIGMFDERWLRMQDVDISYRIQEAGERIGYQGDAVIYHHNRDTLRKLAKEAFIHGYYAPAFQRMHRPFVRSYRKRVAGEPKRQPTHRPEPKLQKRQIWLFWKVFRICKKAGMWAGRLSPPPIEEIFAPHRASDPFNSPAEK